MITCIYWITAMYILHLYLTWKVYLTYVLILISSFMYFDFDIIIHVYYAFDDVDIVLFLKYVVSILMIYCINGFYVFKLTLKRIPYSNLICHIWDVYNLTHTHTHRIHVYYLFPNHFLYMAKSTTGAVLVFTWYEVDSRSYTTITSICAHTTYISMCVCTYIHTYIYWFWYYYSCMLCIFISFCIVYGEIENWGSARTRVTRGWFSYTTTITSMWTHTAPAWVHGLFEVWTWDVTRSALNLCINFMLLFDF